MFLHSYFLDDPGGTRNVREELKRLSTAPSTINNCTNVDKLNKLSTKDQIVTSIATPNTINSSSLVTSTSSTTANDSKYLHKKFKKFCATVDSSSHHQIINNSHNNTITNTPTSTPTTNNAIDGRLNNNSEIVVNKNNNNCSNNLQNTVRNSVNNNILQSLSVPSSHPKHSLTTEEEKQLVKDIIDKNNENFMHHQSANNYYNHHLNNNQSTSSFLITPAASGSQFVTVTTLGNHNSNLQLADHRQKITSSTNNQESIGSLNGNFVIVSQPADSNSNHNSTVISSVPTTTSSTVTTSTTSTPGRYICPYCQLNCAKPSVLQKHIRAHTNERPFPCTLCGFAFKTKSNLYKHCR
jgi:human immunodeficiency virus type I enhancer-binding protein